MDSYEWTVDGTDFRIDVRLYPEGILDASGYPAPAAELAAKILRLAEENGALKSGLRAWKKETVARIRRELLEEVAAVNWESRAADGHRFGRFKSIINRVLPEEEEP